ncbi:hypothetical protein DFH08DRAFT_810503 [Mycena albidolilacea]|uniref:Cellobiose dehydrogenase cytochrome domain-containing protein n=1 Tax=Mycena albidolilacea TaxID=1033008 RepID=A0AAD7EP82_9AGAR|nr:hypothetical protein DFH08DRAFT_810503 [Mycena albidolilacea]
MFRLAFTLNSLFALAGRTALYISAAKPDQFTFVCGPRLRLCMHQAFDAETKSTYGFVLPTNGSLAEDFIAQLSVPLPYGFAGFGPVQSASSGIPPIPLFSIPAFMGFSRSHTVGLAGGMIVQQSTISPDGSQLVPVPASSAGTITISPLSGWNETLINFIFRCQNCVLPEIQRNKPFELVVFNSYEQPEFDTPDAMNARLNIGGAKISAIKVENLRALESRDYATYLTAAELA